MSILNYAIPGLAFALGTACGAALALGLAPASPPAPPEEAPPGGLRREDRARLEAFQRTLKCTPTLPLGALSGGLGGAQGSPDTDRGRSAQDTDTAREPFLLDRITPCVSGIDADDIQHIDDATLWFLLRRDPEFDDYVEDRSPAGVARYITWQQQGFDVMERTACQGHPDVADPHFCDFAVEMNAWFDDWANDLDLTWDDDAERWVAPAGPR